MTDIAVIDPRELQVTPVFKIIEVEDINASHRAGHLVKKTREVVEVRIAGQRDVKVFPSLGMWKREGLRVITYAERWAEQYRAFKEGNPQETVGTALEMLKPYGISPELISLCVALKIYSIEALHSLEGQQLGALGMNASRLKDAARAFMSERLTGAAAMTEIEALRARIAELEAAGATVPVPQDAPTDAQVDAALAAADKAVADLEYGELKDEIERLTGTRPGNVAADTLRSSLAELRQVQAA